MVNTDNVMNAAYRTENFPGGTMQRPHNQGGIAPTTGKYHIRGLDGLRVLALFAVTAYHLLPDKVVGAYLAVDFFFIVAAFLNTQSLLKQWRQVDLWRTYKQRFLRLFPELFTVCTVFLVTAFLFVPKLMQNMLPNYIASSFFANNLWQIFLGDSYFAEAIAPSAFKHLWYIAVLAQLSIVWPLIFKIFAAFIEKRSRLRHVLVYVAAALSIISLTLMFVIYIPGTDPTRVYYGTETRAYAYFLGALLALLFPVDRLQFISYYGVEPVAGAWRADRRFAVKRPYNQNVHFFDLAVIPLLILIFVLYMLLAPNLTIVYRGGLALHACLQAALILCVSIPETFFSKFFDLPLFRFLGARSYVYYLWQYPIMIVLRETMARTGLQRWMSVMLNIVLTVILGELAYRYRENFKLKSLFGEFKSGEIRIQSMLKIFVSLVFVCAIVPALFNSKAVKQDANKVYEEQIKQAAMHEAELPEATAAQVQESYKLPNRDNNENVPQATVNVLEVNVNGNVTKGPYDLETMKKLTKTELSADELAVINNIKVSAVGDSVLLGAAGELGNLFPLFRYKAKESAQVDATLQYMQQLKDKNALGDVLLVAVGQNGYMSEAQAKQFMSMAGDRPVFVYTIYVGKEWESSNNKIWTDLAAQYPNLEIVDWHTFAMNNTDLLWDGIHPDNNGQRAYARLFARSLLRMLGKSDV